MAFLSVGERGAILFESRCYFQAISFKHKPLKSIALSSELEGNRMGTAHEIAMLL
jgi:hypothetical protein